MSKIIILKLVLSLLLITVFSCKKTEDTIPEVNKPAEISVTEINDVLRTDDSLAATQLLRDLYKWHNLKSSRSDIPALEIKGNDTIKGLDTLKISLRVQEMEKTGFFTPKFISDYKKITNFIDAGLKDGTFTEVAGELPSYSEDSDIWCSCQDYPDNYWTTLVIKEFKTDHKSISCSWDFNEEPSEWEFKYNCRLKKIGNQWKIDYLQGFDYERIKREKYL